MKIILGADHRGFALKERLKQYFMSESHEIVDVGAVSFDPDDDYVDYAAKAFDPALWHPSDKVILICGSGHGMDIAANRFPEVRAILGFNNDVVKQGRHDEDANVLIIPADWTAAPEAIRRCTDFIATPFSHESRHLRRLKKLGKLTAL